MKIITSFLYCFLLSKALFPQDYITTHQIGGDSLTWVADLSNDQHGNLYMTGVFRGEIDFGAGLMKPSAGNRDIFVLKLDENHNTLWTRTIGGLEDELSPSLAVDTIGNLYLSGRFGPMVSFGEETRGEADSFTKGRFITKLDTDGSFLWVREFKADNITVNSLEVDAEGNLFVGGHFRDDIDFRIDFDGISDAKSSPHGETAFITKITSEGEYVWTKLLSLFPNPGGRTFMFDIKASPEGAVYFTGTFQNQGYFDVGKDFGVIDTFLNQGRRDIFLTKIMQDGTYAWTRSIGGTSTECAYRIELDEDENVYLVGWFLDQVDFSDGFESEPADLHSTYTEESIYSFLTKISKDGDYFWTRSLGSTEEESFTLGNDIAINRNQIVITGDFPDQIVTNHFFSTANDTLTSNGAQDLYLLGLDLDGNYLWSKSFGGLGREERGRVVIKDNWLWFAGSFYDTVDFAANFPSADADVKTSKGYGDVFLSKFSLDDISSTTLVKGEGFSRLELFPNPFRDRFQLRWETETPYHGLSMEIWDARGQRLITRQIEDRGITLSKTIDMQGYPTGIYILRLMLENGTFQSRKLIKH
ncbi:MAG: T9SS type A sorting domain-containing protein [Saprospiraceae bacterium]|nr:T9SS type A sorting domain-containing protein [Saprospiraceae bacterium]